MSGRLGELYVMIRTRLVIPCEGHIIMALAIMRTSLHVLGILVNKSVLFFLSTRIKSHAYELNDWPRNLSRLCG